MRTLEAQDGYRVRPLTWQEGREILREKFNDREHWMMIVHGSAVRLLIEIEQRYYAGDRNGDFTLITGFHRGHVFAVVAAKKRQMPAYKLASMLRQYTDVRLSERELLRRDLLIVAHGDYLMDAATELACKLLSNGLAMAS
jgi:hypothetical protein